MGTDGGTDTRQLGAGLALLGAAALLLSVFLPLAESSTFGRVVDNSLIQHGEGWILVVIAVAIAIACVRATTGDGRPRPVIVLGLIALGFAIYFGTNDDLLTLRAAADTEGMGVVEALDVLSYSEKASPGIGVYVAGVGGLLAAVGGYLMRLPHTADE